MRSHIAQLALIALSLSIASVGWAEPVAVSALTTQMKGTTATLEGKASLWKDSWKPTAPNTFFLTDNTGSVRVCIWPDELTKVSPAVTSAMKTGSLPVRATGKVDVFRDKVEIHVQNGATMQIGTVTTSTAPLSPPAHR